MVNYWELKNGLVFEVKENYPFIKLLKTLLLENKSKNILEIGGFPGYYAIWVKKHLKIDATLLDYVIHPQILKQLELANSLNKNCIQVIEADLFHYNSDIKYDLVVSNGLIEHFVDTKNIIQKHTNFLASNGILLITLPNFKSLNGWFQKQFDFENYQKHNISCMDRDLLKHICIDLGLIEVSVKYSGKFMLWLERENEKTIFVRLFKKIIWLPLKIFFKLIPFETKSFSPYIVITAKKP